MTSGERKRRGLLGLCLTGTVLFAGLGVWQIDRLAWKRALIARVEARVHAPAIPAPTRGRWSAAQLREAEYRHVAARGIYLHDKETLVDALTELGAGSWVVTPLRTADGVILVNRGFVPPGRRDPRTRASGQRPGAVSVSGLMRLSEPGGRILRPNEPYAGRWFSRDVAAIGRARGLTGVAPYFIDADKSAMAVPVGGLTVVRFRNAHLVYALTWFALAALSLAAGVIVRKPRGGRCADTAEAAAP